PDASVVGRRQCARAPFRTPRVEPSVNRLGRVLPFPFMRQALACPGSIGTGVFHRDPGHRLVCPAIRITSALPVPQEVMVIRWMVASRFQKSLELSVCNRRAINIEAANMQAMTMRPSWSWLPGILNVYTGVVATFNFNATYLETEVGLGNADHSRGS